MTYNTCGSTVADRENHSSIRGDTQGCCVAFSRGCERRQSATQVMLVVLMPAFGFGVAEALSRLPEPPASRSCSETCAPQHTWPPASCRPLAIEHVGHVVSRSRPRGDDLKPSRCRGSRPPVRGLRKQAVSRADDPNRRCRCRGSNADEKTSVIADAVGGRPMPGHPMTRNNE
jgi:hypothetical protein